MLEEILKHKREELATLPALNPADLPQCQHDFEAAITKPGLSIIAEVKRRSPSLGAIDESIDPLAQAQAYVDGGARVISVLIDRKYFGGSWENLAAVANSVQVPVLCKEFILDAKQVHHARRSGAAACLLIVAALDDDTLHTLLDEVHNLGMSALVEVHNESEAARAINVGAPIIGVNNRNLQTLEIELATVSRIASLIPSNHLLVAESGYKRIEHLDLLPESVDGLLVGSALMRAREPASMLRSWLEHTQARTEQRP